jgi:pilus assembly protein CpaB
VKPKRARSVVIVPGARVIAVGQPRVKASGGAQEQQDPGQVVPVTFALDKRQELKVAHAQVFAADLRLALLRRGDPSDRTLGETIYRGGDPKKGDPGVTG